MQPLSLPLFGTDQSGPVRNRTCVKIELSRKLVQNSVNFNYYLLIGFAFHTVKYKGRGPRVRSDTYFLLHENDITCLSRDEYSMMPHCQGNAKIGV